MYSRKDRHSYERNASRKRVADELVCSLNTKEKVSKWTNEKKQGEDSLTERIEELADASSVESRGVEKKVRQSVTDEGGENLQVEAIRSARATSVGSPDIPRRRPWEPKVRSRHQGRGEVVFASRPA